VGAATKRRDLVTRVRWAWLSGVACLVFDGTMVRAQSVQCPGADTAQPPKSTLPVKGSLATRAPVPTVQDITVSCGTSSNTQTVSGEPKTPAGERAERPTLGLQIADAFIRFLNAVAWPALLLAFMLIFRKPIGRLIGRTKSLTWGDKGVEFAEEVAAAEDKADIEPSPEAALAVMRDTMSAASKDPRGTIPIAWREVEQAVNDLIRAKNLAPAYASIQKRPFTGFRLIQRAELLDSKYITLFHELRRLRNEAAHASKFTPPPDAVIRYAELAKELADELRRKAQAG
jgi:hypothetical protein